MFLWLFSKIVSKLLPILIQAYVVVNIVNYTLKEILSHMSESNKLYDNIKALEHATATAKAALYKIITGMGGELPEVQTSSLDLATEVKKLESMI